MIEHRVRLFRGFLLKQTSHPQPIAGTPTEVPVPSRIISPRKSIVLGVLDKKLVSREGLEFTAPEPAARGMHARSYPLHVLLLRNVRTFDGSFRG